LASTGDSGKITLKATSSVPTILFGGQTHTIDVGAGAKLLSHATDGFDAGAVSVEATTTNFVFDYLIMNDLSLIVNKSTITIDGATLKGGDMTVAAKAIDFNVAQELSKQLDGHGVVFAGAIQSVLGPLDDFLSLPISIMVRLADAEVTLKGDARISPPATTTSPRRRAATPRARRSSTNRTRAGSYSLSTSRTQQQSHRSKATRSSTRAR
jgi:hypothetical protein